MPWRAWRRLAASSDGTVAFAKHNAYEIEVYPANAPSYVIKRNVAWFTPWSSTEAGIAPSAVGSLWIDGSRELLWVNVAVADPAKSHVRFEIKSIHDVSKLQELSDTYVEVFDLRKRSLIASAKFPDPFSFTHDGRAWAAREEEGGNVQIQMWRVALKTRR